MATRRDVLRSLVATGGAGALSACLEATGDADADPEPPTGDPSRRPRRQHAWNDRLRRDDDGNFLQPRHHVYLSLEYAGTDREADRADLEAALRDLEAAFEASHRGLLFTVGYSAAYFASYGDPVELPRPRPIVEDENVRLDEADVFLHLASDAARAVLEAEEALFGERATANGEAVTDLSGLLERVHRRTGFFGFGEPAERSNLNGIPSGVDDPGPVPEEAPFFMGFRSGFRRNQATEDRVTIREGRFAGGTTQHVSGLKLNLSEWFALDGDEQVAKLFAPDRTMTDVGPIGSALSDHNGVAGQTDADLRAAATESGVVGHAQKLARHREDGRPPILRRDVNSDDLDEAGVVFVSLQRSIEDFRRLRRSMEGRDVAGTGGVGEQHDNGILRYIQTRHRGNFLVPPREARSLPE
jgi:hypothetical protein